eukprot:11075765-Heterocapsa_arctica.AAC.1
MILYCARGLLRPPLNSDRRRRLLEPAHKPLGNASIMVGGLFGGFGGSELASQAHNLCRMISVL